MVYLVLSIILSASLFICFKWFNLKGILLLPAITGNYIACILTGVILENGFHPEFLSLSSIGASLFLGVLFFFIFYAMGYASSHIGVGITSAATKLSLVIPVAFGAWVLNEPFGINLMLALILAIPAVLLLTYKKGEKLKIKALAIPIIIFIGSGFIDTSINLLQKTLDIHSPSSIIIIIFTAALFSAILSQLYLKPKLLKEYKSIRYGLLLGIPNYFSVYFMMLALHSETFTSGQFYMINNSGVILLSFVLAFIFFSEKMNQIKVIGLLVAILSIYLALN